MANSSGTASIAQTPVNISTTNTPTESFSAVLTANYQSAHIDIVNDGKHIDAEFLTPQNSVTYHGEVYTLKGFHFHTDSEHTFNGLDTGGEIHLVHQSSSGKLLVVGVLLEGVAAGDPSIDPQLTSFFQTLQSQKSTLEQQNTPVDGGYFDPSLLISGSSQVYNYGGSLTTSPYSEAEWVVAANTLKVNTADLANFSQLQLDFYGSASNSRPVQAELFLGTSAQDLLEGDRNGMSTDDLIYGKDGKDTLDGGQKDDKLFGEAGKDLLLGGAGNDYLDGGSGADTLLGGNGNDKLFGGAGSDILKGGAGSDTMIFATGFGSDRINGFANGFDKIDLKAFTTSFGALTVTQSGANTVISGAVLGIGNTITLASFTASNVDATDFLF
jgi:carbonic anhydrase